LQRNPRSSARRTLVLDPGCGGYPAKLSDESNQGLSWFPQSRSVSRTSQSHLTWCIGSQQRARLHPRPPRLWSPWPRRTGSPAPPSARRCLCKRILSCGARLVIEAESDSVEIVR